MLSLDYGATMMGSISEIVERTVGISSMAGGDNDVRLPDSGCGLFTMCVYAGGGIRRGNGSSGARTTGNRWQTVGFFVV